MPKITMIGAGSAMFAQQLITDVLAIDGLKIGTIALVDIDAERLELAHALAERIVAATGKPWHVQASTNRLDVLADSDYVVNTIEVAGLANVRHDYDIPLKYGVDQCIGDTIGLGGIFKALRTGPAWLEIVRDVERLAPQATILNYTNPMSILTLAALQTTSVPVVGLCHSVQHTSRQLARYLDVPYTELDWQVAGINHNAWFTRLRHRGEDQYTRLRALSQPGSPIYEQDPVRCEMLHHFGVFVTESSGHFSEYVPYFRARAADAARYTRAGYRGESGFYANNWPTWRREHEATIRATLAGERELSLTRSAEYATAIIEGQELGRPQVIYGNVCNTGLISNLLDGCVEVACLVDGRGIQPTHAGALPEQLAALNRSHMAVHSLVTEALLTGDRQAAKYALLLDPLTAAVCAPAAIHDMFEELWAAQAPYLEAFT